MKNSAQKTRKETRQDNFSVFFLPADNAREWVRELRDTRAYLRATAALSETPLPPPPAFPPPVGPAIAAVAFVLIFGVYGKTSLRNARYTSCGEAEKKREKNCSRTRTHTHHTT